MTSKLPLTLSQAASKIEAIVGAELTSIMKEDGSGYNFIVTIASTGKKHFVNFRTGKITALN